MYLLTSIEPPFSTNDETGFKKRSGSLGTGLPNSEACNLVKYAVNTLYSYYIPVISSNSYNLSTNLYKIMQLGSSHFE